MEKLEAKGVSVTSLCRTLSVSRSGYYKYLANKNNMTRTKNEELIKTKLSRLLLSFPGMATGASPRSLTAGVLSSTTNRFSGS